MQLRVDSGRLAQLYCRLGELESRGLLIHRQLPRPASVHIYELTPWRYETEATAQALGRWAARSPHHDPILRISGVSLLLWFRTMLDHERAKGIDAEVGFRFGDDVYYGHLTSSGFAIAQGDPTNARFIFTGTPMALGGAVRGDASISKLEKAGTLTVVGDRKLARRCRISISVTRQAAGLRDRGGASYYLPRAAALEETMKGPQRPLLADTSSTSLMVCVSLRAAGDRQ